MATYWGIIIVRCIFHICFSFELQVFSHILYVYTFHLISINLKANNFIIVKTKYLKKTYRIQNGFSFLFAQMSKIIFLKFLKFKNKDLKLIRQLKKIGKGNHYWVLIHTFFSIIFTSFLHFS